MIFLDRYEAGRELADRLLQYAGRTDLLVLALPRGGVPVGFEVARRLNAPLDVFMVRKLGVPGHEELAMGALATGEVLVLNTPLLQQLRMSPEMLQEVYRREKQELARREELYRSGRPPYEIEGKEIIVVDDGLATGASMKAAVLALRRFSPKKIVVAVPVSAEETYLELKKLVNETVCLNRPDPFIAVGAWYEDFSQTSDEEVQELLHLAASKWKAA